MASEASLKETFDPAILTWSGISDAGRRASEAMALPMSSKAVNAAGVLAEPIGSQIPFFVFIPNHGPKLRSATCCTGLILPALHE